jgi:hypothetical protein
MANPEYLQILEQGVEAWNAWRDRHREIRPNLNEADLRRADLRKADLRDAYLIYANLNEADLRDADLRYSILAEADLSDADLRDADLSGADLNIADLRRADLHKAYLSDANLSHANLSHANLRFSTLAGVNFSDADLSDADLRGADLGDANLSRANLTGAGVSEVSLYRTVFGATNLTAVRGLETCEHLSPSTLDHRTLACSGPLPLAFLRGCGLPDALIDYLPSLLNAPFQFYSCFISYASKDHAFAERLHADLQNNGVRCWFAPKDLPIGARTLVSIDESIRLYDKLLLILSKSSVKSQWVEGEVATALARERQQGSTILFPVRIDNTVMTLETGWPALIRNTRNIGDFRRWKTHDVYQKAFDRLLRDLTAAARQLQG